MEEYIANPVIEKKLVKPVRKQFKQWEIGRWFVWILIGIVLCLSINYLFKYSDMFYGGGDEIIAYFLGIIGNAFIPFIAMLLVYAISIGGGRDILKVRLNEKVYLNDECLINVFTPKYKRLIDADVVEYKIEFPDIHEMIWNADLHRLEINADFQYKMTHRFKEEKIQEKKNETVILYEYFDSMQQLMNHLEQKSNKRIIGRN